MRRRALLIASCLASGMVHLPQAAKAQQGGKTYRVGVLTPAAVQWQATVFGSAMRQLGYEEGVNLTLVVRDADNRLDTLRRLADELVRENVDVIVAINTPGARAAIDATKVIPIVMSVVADPVSTGLVTSFARPGGNATGASTLGRDLTGKRLELLKEAVPAADRIAVLLNPRDPIVKPQIDDVRRAAAGLGVEAELFPVHGPDDIDRAFTDLTRWSAQAILRLAGQALPVSGETIERAHRHRLPTMLLTKEEVHAGALMSYDADRAEIFRRTAQFVDKILRSEKPGNLPIEQPTVFKLVINLKTARAIGLTIPPAVLARADELIE